MVEPDPDNQMDAEPQIPKSLSDDLAGVYGKSIEAPQDLDERILATAHEQLARRPLRGALRGDDSQGNLPGSFRGSFLGNFRGRRWR